MANLIGKNILIVDEVDDTRTTLEYAVNELKKDVETARIRSGRGVEEGKTTFNIFVLHVSYPAELIVGIFNLALVLQTYPLIMLDYRTKTRPNAGTFLKT